MSSSDLGKKQRRYSRRYGSFDDVRLGSWLWEMGWRASASGECVEARGGVGTSVLTCMSNTSCYGQSNTQPQCSNLTKAEISLGRLSGQDNHALLGGCSSTYNDQDY